MTTPYWRYPPQLNGRMIPTHSVAQDGYFVYCLGEDVLDPRKFRLHADDAISVEQMFNIVTPIDLLRFSWHTRQPETMPTSRDIINSGTVSFKNGDLVSAGDSLLGITIGTPDSPFTPDDYERQCQISGASVSGNNGTFTVTGVPWNQGDIVGGEAAMLNNSAMVTDLADTGVTVRMLGLRWVSRAYLYISGAWEEKLAITEHVDHEWYRTDLALHLSQFTGATGVKFELTLELQA